ncbi:MAG: hypothetical protein ISS23_04110 [Nanoarchaeota archaeon]|nr:hypothetical protein [Nanoarchaeota archaeon]
MALDQAGRLTTAIPDNCRNYDPIKSQPKKVVSAKSGMLYHCRKFENHEGRKDGCLFCDNWITLEGEYKGCNPERLAENYLLLYEHNPDKFKELFKESESIPHKKCILNAILEHSWTNKEVDNWLNENESELIREVAFN